MLTAVAATAGYKVRMHLRVARFEAAILSCVAAAGSMTAVESVEGMGTGCMESDTGRRSFQAGKAARLREGMIQAVEAGIEIVYAVARCNSRGQTRQAGQGRTWAHRTKAVADLVGPNQQRPYYLAFDHRLSRTGEGWLDHAHPNAAAARSLEPYYMGHFRHRSHPRLSLWD